MVTTWSDGQWGGAGAEVGQLWLSLDPGVEVAAGGRLGMEGVA